MLDVSIPDGKPPHVRRSGAAYRDVAMLSFNPRWEAASRATRCCASPYTRSYEFQSQMGSRLTCDARAERASTCRRLAFQSQMGSRLTCDADACTVTHWHIEVSIPDGKPPHVRPRSVDHGCRLSRVSIPDGKPPHVRRTAYLACRRRQRRFQSQMGSRLTCDDLWPRLTAATVEVSIPDGKPPHVRRCSTALTRTGAGFNPRWEAASRATQLRSDAQRDC